MAPNARKTTAIRPNVRTIIALCRLTLTGKATGIASSISGAGSAFRGINSPRSAPDAPIISGVRGGIAVMRSPLFLENTSTPRMAISSASIDRWFSPVMPANVSSSRSL